MIFFLSTQALLDILSGRPNVEAWQSTIPLSSVEVSPVSLGQATVTIRRIANAGRKQSFENALAGFISAINISAGIIPFDEAAAKAWATLTEMDLPYNERSGTVTQLGPPSRMVVASALSRDASLVEEPQPYHALIPGLRVTSP